MFSFFLVNKEWFEWGLWKPNEVLILIFYETMSRALFKVINGFFDLYTLDLSPDFQNQEVVILDISPYKNAFFKSNWNNFHTNWKTTKIISQIVPNQAIGEKVAEKSMPYVCVHLFAINLVLYHSIISLDLHLTMKTHLHPKISTSEWESTHSHVSHDCNAFIFSTLNPFILDQVMPTNSE